MKPFRCPHCYNSTIFSNEYGQCNRCGKNINSVPSGWNFVIIAVVAIAYIIFFK